MHFRRKMKEALGWNEITENQLKNELHALLTKYNEVKDKLKSSGFGVDPDIDSTIDKGMHLTSHQICRKIITCMCRLGSKGVSLL